MSTKSFWKEIKKPIIGLSPMDGYSDSAFRRVCKFVNPDIVTVTEFTSADGLHFSSERLKKKLSFDPSEQPVIAQIFGKNTETFISAAKICEDMGFTGIDINMGCPSKKVVKSEHGVALRRNLDLAFKLIETLATATALPVSVKSRLGWSDADDLEMFCLGAQNAGADMICIHARTYQNPYGVPAQWEPLFNVKKKLLIPLIGNGGINTIQEGLEVCSPLDGFYIGQATFGNPWVFSVDGKPSDFMAQIPLIKNHAAWIVEDKGESRGMREFRKHLLAYLKGFYGAKEIRSKACRVSTLEDCFSILDSL